MSYFFFYIQHLVQSSPHSKYLISNSQINICICTHVYKHIRIYKVKRLQKSGVNNNTLCLENPFTTK